MSQPLVKKFNDEHGDARARIFRDGDVVEVFPPESERGCFGLGPLKKALDAYLGEYQYRWLGRVIEESHQQKG